jgi:serine/threonine protein kinase
MAAITARDQRGTTPTAPAEEYVFFARIDPGIRRGHGGNHAGIFLVQRASQSQQGAGDAELLVEKRMPFYTGTEILATEELRILSCLNHPNIVRRVDDYIHPREGGGGTGNGSDNGSGSGGGSGGSSSSGAAGGPRRRGGASIKTTPPPPESAPERREARLFTEYCSFGTLMDLRDRMEAECDNIRSTSAIDPVDDPAGAAAVAPQLPEAFVWYLFMTMAHVLRYLATGEGGGPDPRHERQQWELILHRDVKTSNIFLRERPDPPAAQEKQKTGHSDLSSSSDDSLPIAFSGSDPADFPFSAFRAAEANSDPTESVRVFHHFAKRAGYPDPVLGDWGWAIGSADPDLVLERIPQATAGTSVYQGPERPLHDRHGRSDVYGLGAAIEELCTNKLRRRLEPLPIERPMSGPGDAAAAAPGFDTGVRPDTGYYSHFLVHAIQRAKQWDVAERPDAERLLDELIRLFQLARPRFERLPAWAAKERNPRPMYVQTELARRTYNGEPGSENAYQLEQSASETEARRRRRLRLENSKLLMLNSDYVRKLIGDTGRRDRATGATRLRGGDNLVNVLLKFRRSDFGRIEVYENDMEEIQAVVT